MTHSERMAVIKQNRRDYKHGASMQHVDACAINGWVPDHVYDQVIKGRNSLNIACHDIDYLIEYIESMTAKETTP
jgi:hypothetical protein